MRIFLGTYGGTATANARLGAELRQLSAGEIFLLKESPCHRGRVLLFTVNGVVHSSHFVGGNASGNLIESSARSWAPLKQFWSHDQDGIVGWKVVTIVLQHDEPQRGDQAVGVRSGHNVDANGFARRGRANPDPSRVVLPQTSGRRSGLAPHSRPAAPETRSPLPA